MHLVDSCSAKMTDRRKAKNTSTAQQKPAHWRWEMDMLIFIFLSLFYLVKDFKNHLSNCIGGTVVCYKIQSLPVDNFKIVFCLYLTEFATLQPNEIKSLIYQKCFIPRSRSVQI